MDIGYTPEHDALRRELRAYYDRLLTPEIVAEIARSEGVGPVVREVVRQMGADGWLGIGWPVEYGGQGRGFIEQFIFFDESMRAGAPVPMLTINSVAPTIMKYGSSEQKAFFLPRILRGEIHFCIGYTEPDAGTDLASLKTRAVRDGDEWVINGQKIFTSLATDADYVWLAVRTDPEAPKHKGITYFIVDMKSPGITVRPLVNMTGTHEFNEVFFDNVRVPKENIIGEENRGWYAAVTTLDFERSSIGSAVGMVQTVEELIEYAREHVADHTSALTIDPMLRYELADRLVETQVARMLSYRVASLQNRGLIPNYEASALKLFSTETNQRIAGTGIKVLGLYGQLDRGSEWAPLKGRLAYTFLRSVAFTIEGGTSEIQRNIIAQRGLGLPRD